MVATLVGCGGNDSVDDQLDRIVAAGAPGVILVTQDGGTVRADALGFAAVNPAVPMRADQRFRIGSVTKSFVATLVLRLAQDGTLGLDDTVERWLPGLLPDGGEITVRRLLAHRSGLSDYVDASALFGDRHRRWTPRELVALAVDSRRQSSPTAHFEYSSTNYLVLGLVAEAATGEPLGTLLRERLFEPLGLARTRFEPGLVHGPHVHGHRPPAHQGVVTGPPVDVHDEPAWWTWAAGAIVSTAHDVQRFFAALLHGHVVAPALLREMEAVGPAGRLRYGLGLAAFPTPCGRAWGHTGNVLGTIVVAWNTKDAARQLVLVVNAYPLSGELEEAVRELQDLAFCST